MIPTEHEYTVATHAAAKKAWEGITDALPWEELHLTRQREIMEQVLPIVDAALSALPERDLVSLIAERIGQSHISAMLGGVDMREAINADLDYVKVLLGDQPG